MVSPSWKCNVKRSIRAKLEARAAELRMPRSFAQALETAFPKKKKATKIPKKVKMQKFKAPTVPVVDEAFVNAVRVSFIPKAAVKTRRLYTVAEKLAASESLARAS